MEPQHLYGPTSPAARQVEYLRKVAALCRTDIHVLRMPDGSYRMVNGPVTDEALEEHLKGGKSISVYPIVGKLCRRLSFDVDFHKLGKPIAEVTDQFRGLTDLLRSNGIKYNIEVSGGEAGLHIDIYFADWVSARNARRWASRHITACGFTVGNGGGESGQIEIFPKQDEAINGPGNCFTLPLSRKSKPLDPDTLEICDRATWQPPTLEDLLNPPLLDEPEPKLKSQRRRRKNSRVDLGLVKELLEQLSADDRDRWIGVCAALKHLLGEDGFELFVAWSEKFENFVSENDCRKTWDSFGKKTTGPKLGMGSLIKWAQETGWNGPSEKGVFLNRLAPRECAAAFLNQRYNGLAVLHLARYQQEWRAYQGDHWAKVPQDTIKAELGEFLHEALDFEAMPFNPRGREVREVLEFVGDIALIEAEDSQSPPIWQSGRIDYAPSDIIPMRNGLLHLPTRELLPHTPDFFSFEVRDFDYDPNTSLPVQWVLFIDDLWPGDQFTKALLQEVMGLLLTVDLSFQKIILIIGPRRAGKSTLISVIEVLVGLSNIVSADLAQMSKDFGLESFIGKSVAIFPDARFSQKGDASGVVQRLAGISGEDVQSVWRKNKLAWQGKLRVRAVIVTNEMMALTDNSGALASRFVPIKLERTFEGREDAKLRDHLLTEAPQIFHWALEGYHRLKRRQEAGERPFTMPPASLELLGELRDLMAPFAVFADECLDFADGSRVSKADAYAAYRDWAGPQGIYAVPSMAEFGRQLQAHSHKVRPIQTHRGPRSWANVSLKPRADYGRTGGDDVPF
jgi:putative DNA primase/helicase